MKIIALLASLTMLVGLCSPPGIEPGEEDHSSIRLNQLGYYPGSVKEFVAVDLEADEFRILDETGKSRYRGKLVDAGTWDSSGE